MRALAVGYFFGVSVAASIPVWLGYRLRQTFHSPWLLPYTLYLAGWAAFVLLSVVQYMLIGTALPSDQWEQVAASTRPLFAIVFAGTLYAYSSFMAQVAGTRLPRAFTVGFALVWSAIAVALAVAATVGGDRPSATASAVSSATAALLKLGLTYGWIAYVLAKLGRLDDDVDRRGFRTFVLLLMAGLVAFDVAVRGAAAVVGPSRADLVISAVQVGANYPALLWLRRFLGERALVRPPSPLPPDSRAALETLGLSARERDVVALLVEGLSHKDIAERLGIAPETVKKHTYNAHRKLGVQNRVQLSYVIQNRLAKRP